MSGTTETASQLSSQQRILLALDEAAKKLEAFEQAKSEPIAIVGLGCRFPGGANTPEAYWQLLQEGVDAITPVPTDRWNIDDFYDPDPAVPGKMYTRYGGFLEGVGEFDPQFFGISPREALHMDPQQRLLLEVAWEALEHAGAMPDPRQPTKAGVFVGVTTNDYARLITPEGDLSQIDAYYLTGNPLNAVAGRLAYTFGLQGPCMAIDTACSSSLVAVHLAVQSLRNGECDQALAGGVNLILSPDNTVALSKTQMLSTDGRCKTFDASADGIVRGEGCGVIVLKRLSDAVAAGDRIVAVIKSSAVNQDGRSSGFTVPNKSAQQALIETALREAKLQPSEIDYIEAHGTGTPLGDPIELRALGAVLGKTRPAENPLLIGSVKTNFGHLESAAGIAGLIKVVLSMQHDMIPPHLHFTQPNPHISWTDLPIKVAAESTAWQKNGRPRAAGVSSFGASGTNAHVILEESPTVPPADTTETRTHHLFTLSAKSDAALQQQLKNYAAYLCEHPDLAIENICFSANTGRSHLDHRIGLLAASSKQLQTMLLALADSSSSDRDIYQGSRNSLPQVAFLFSGQGAQYSRMGKALYDSQPCFRRWLDECDRLLQPHLNASLLELLFSDADTTHSLDQTANTQPALFAVEYALAQLWLSWGVRPTVLMGHSVGEYVAACIAGVFSLEDGLKLIAERGQLMQALPAGGGMVSVLASEAVVASAIADIADITIAAVNGPHSIVVSGPKVALEQAIAQFDQQTLKHKTLAVSHAFHSAQMEPMLARFRQVAEQVSYHPPKLSLISNVTGELVTADVATADYWCRHVRQPVLFSQGMQCLSRLVPDAYLEIGPKPVLLGMGRQCIADHKRSDNALSTPLWLPSLRPPQANLSAPYQGNGQSNGPSNSPSTWQTLLSSLAQLYVAGAEINWNAVDGDYAQQRIVLPSYPFQRQRFWVADSRRQLPQAIAATSLAGSASEHPLLGHRLALAGDRDVRFTSQLSLSQQSYLKDHCIYQQVIVPATVYVEMAIAAGQQVLNCSTVTLQSMVFQQPLMLSGTSAKTVQVVLTPQVNPSQVDTPQPHKTTIHHYTFEIFSLDESQDAEAVWTCHAVGQVGAAASVPGDEPVDLLQLQQGSGTPVPVDAFYQRLAQQGMAYGPCFQGVQQLLSTETSALGEIRLPGDVPSAGYCLHPALLDACFQVLGAMMSPVKKTEKRAATKTEKNSEAAYLPVAIEALSVMGDLGQGPLWSQVELLPSSQKAKRRQLKVNLSLINAAGQRLVHLQGLTLKRVPQRLLQRVLQQDKKSADSWLYRLDWQPVKTPPKPELATQRDRWLVFADSDDTALLESLKRDGLAYTHITAGTDFKQCSDTHFQLDPTQPLQFSQLLAALPQSSAVHGIVYSWGASAVEIETLSGAALVKAQQHACGGALHLLQALVADHRSLPGGLWLLTRGAQSIDRAADTSADRSAARSTVSLQPQQAALWGLGRVIALEHPELRCHCLDLAPSQPLPPLLNDLYSQGRDHQLAYREGQRFAARLARFTDPFPSVTSETAAELPTAPFQVRLREYGLLENLQLVPMQRQVPGVGEVEIQVRAVGLNFRDVLNALGMLKTFTEAMGIADAQDLPFGGECAGIIAAVGEGVSDLKVGDAVIAAQTIGSLSSFVTVPADFVVPKPERLSFEEAATIPTAFLTAYYALKEKAQLTAGDRVLIHSAAGGVGQAAVQIAHWLGAEVWGTASEPKWDALKSMGVAHVFNSRTLDFTQQVLDATHGDGVDVVLNSLNGDYIPGSLKALVQQGRFVEIGKLGIWSPEKMAAQRPDVIYMPFDLLDISLADPTAIRQLLDALGPLFDEGTLTPLNHVCFPIEKRVDAFRYMAQAKHIGKVVISLPEAVEAVQEPGNSASAKSESGGHLDPVISDPAGFEPAFKVNADGAYLVTGGLGSLGLQVAQWLVQQGATHLALLGRHDPSKLAIEVIARLQQKGATVQLLKADVGDSKELAEAIAHIAAPLNGVFHTAGVLEDAMLASQSWQSFAQVMRPKVAGTWLLHQLLAERDLDCFVCFSSVSALVGSPGQANYAAANAFMDSLMHYRRSVGLSGLSVNWGPWANSGMAAAVHSRNQARWAAQGIQLIDPEQGLSLLSQLLETARVAQAAVLPVDWRLYLSQLPPTVELPLLQAFFTNRDEPSATFLAELTSAAPSLQRPLLLTHLQSHLAQVLGLSTEYLDPQQGFADLGMDSLMAVELRNRLQASLGCPISPTLAFDYPTIAALAAYLADVLDLPAVAEPEEDDLLQVAPPPEPADSINTLSDDEAEALLMSKLESMRY